METGGSLSSVESALVNSFFYSIGYRIAVVLSSYMN